MIVNITEVALVNKTCIIDLATSILIVSVVTIGIAIWMNMSSSTNILVTITRPFTSFQRHHEFLPNLEHDSIPEDSFC